MQGDSKDTIEAKLKVLSEASAGMAQKLYAEQQAEGEGAAQASASDAGEDDNVVDAEFEELKDDDKPNA